MGKKSKNKGYENIPLDIDPKIVCKIIKGHTKYIISEPSYSYIKKVLKKCKKSKKPLDELYKAFGKAMFNEIMIDAIMEKIALETDILDLGIGLEKDVVTDV